MKRAQIAAVVSRANAEDSRPARRPNADAGRLFYRRQFGTVHHWQPPVAPPFELLAELETVTEEAEVAANADGLVLHQWQAVVAGGGRAGQHALADAVDRGFLQGVAVEGEQQQADAGPAVR